MPPAADPKAILVLCEGNHCRSPLAVALLRRALGPGFTVESAGLAALEGIPAHPEAARLAAAQRKRAVVAAGWAPAYAWGEGESEASKAWRR